MTTQQLADLRAAVRATLPNAGMAKDLRMPLAEMGTARARVYKLSAQEDVPRKEVP